MQILIFIWGGGGEVRIYSCTLLPTSKVILLLIISFQKVHDSQNFWQKRNKLCSFSKNNLGTTCHRTSLTFFETIYTSEAQSELYEKCSKIRPLAPPPIDLKSQKKDHAPRHLNVLPVYGA